MSHLHVFVVHTAHSCSTDFANAKSNTSKRLQQATATSYTLLGMGQVVESSRVFSSKTSCGFMRRSLFFLARAL